MDRPISQEGTSAAQRAVLTLAVLGLFAAACFRSPDRAPRTPPGERPLERLRREARALEPLVRSPLGRAFLAETAALPRVAPRVVYQDSQRGRFLTEAQARLLSEEERRGLERKVYDEEFYYFTRYGTPLAYVRPLEVLARAGLAQVSGRRILDFGHGGIGQLRLLAALGAEVTGVEIHPLLPALYSDPADQGRVVGTRGWQGKLTLVNGRYPADPAVREAVGSGYDLILSKNVLKRGYLHPAEPVPERQRIRLGVSDEEFVRTLFSALVPGGRVLLYNLCPAPAPPGKPYIPWADGRSPFSRGLWESAGFRVLAFDQDDTGPARAMGRALGWDRGPDAMDLERDLFALYTLVERPR
jgi:SAM-dependent methyltransferase